MASEHLRPIERRVVAMREQGLEVDAIAARLKRSPQHVERMLTWIEIPRSGPPARRSPTAMERRVLALRADGMSYEAIAARFKRSARFIRQVEGMAHYRLALELL